MSLTVLGAAVEVPADAGDPAQIFKELGETFKLDPKVINHMVATEGLTTLEKFAHVAMQEMTWRR